jgi:hypothetical protein
MSVKPVEAQSESLGYCFQRSLSCSPFIGRFNHPHDQGAVVFSAHNGRRCTRSDVDLEAHTFSLIDLDLSSIDCVDRDGPPRETYGASASMIHSLQIT